MTNKQKEADEEERRKRKVIELSAEEKQAILMSDEFHKFFDRSTRLIERAMCEDYQRYITNNKRSLGKLCLSL